MDTTVLQHAPVSCRNARGCSDEDTDVNRLRTEFATACNYGP